jgi:hypothetical protein
VAEYGKVSGAGLYDEATTAVGIEVEGGGIGRD